MLQAQKIRYSISEVKCLYHGQRVISAIHLSQLGAYKIWCNTTQQTPT